MSAQIGLTEFKDEFDSNLDIDVDLDFDLHLGLSPLPATFDLTVAE